MARRVLGISWLHGSFQAVATSGGVVQASWAAPGSVLTSADFATALKRSITETAFKGRQVTVVIDHRNLLFHLQETPPAKGKMLGRVLQRLVAQSQFFDEPAVWRHIELPSSKTAHRCLLAVLPQSLVFAIEHACAEANLDLIALLPPATVVAQHLKGLEASAEETVILATDLGGSLNIILGRTSGQLLLSRTVVLAGRMQTDRAAQELNRTLHYAQQQFGVTVNRLFISGADAYAALKEVSIRDGLKVFNDSTTEGPLELPRHAAGLPARSAFNFANRQSSGELALRTAAAAGLAAAVVMSVSATLHIESSVRAREQRAASMIEANRTESQVQGVSSRRDQEARAIQAFVSAVGSTNDAPVAELFVRALPELLPASMRVTELSVGQNASGWEFEIKGVIMDGRSDLGALLEDVEKALQTSVFKAKVTDSTQQQLIRGALEEPLPGGHRGVRDSLRTFFVKGTIP
jgi:hypothetical protein